MLTDFQSKTEQNHTRPESQNPLRNQEIARIVGFIDRASDKLLGIDAPDSDSQDQDNSDYVPLGWDAVVELGQKYVGDRDKQFETLVDLTFSLTEFDEVTGEYHGPIAEAAAQILNANVGHRNFPNPLQLLSNILSLAMRKTGRHISKEERDRRKSVLMNGWDANKLAVLRAYCQSDVIYTWDEIAEVFGTDKRAVIDVARRKKISKPNYIMDLHDRHNRLLEIAASGEVLTHAQIADRLGITTEEAIDPKYVIQGYCERNKIKLPVVKTMVYERTLELKHLNGIRNSSWFKNNAAKLRELHSVLSLPDYQAIPRMQLGQLFNCSSRNVRGLINSHLLIVDEGSGEVRLKSRDELVAYIEDLERQIREMIG